MSLASTSSSNPYVLVQQALLRQFSPVLPAGFLERIGVLLTLTSYVTIACVVLLVLTILVSRKRRKPIWLCKIERRPQGRYILFNHLLIGPIWIGIAYIVWTIYLNELRNWWTSGTTPTSIVYWVTFVHIPLIIGGWFITVAVLAGANLCSAKANDPSQHILGPLAMNSGILFFAPLSLVALVVTSIRCGIAYSHIAKFTKTMYLDAELKALSYEGGLSAVEIDELVQYSMLNFFTVAQGLFADLVSTYRASSITAMISIAVLVTFNINGGVMVMRSLRVTDHAIIGRDVPVVAPLKSFVAEGSDSPRALNPTEEDCESFDGVSIARESQEDWYGSFAAKAVEVRGRRLDWDLVLFYYAIAPTYTLLMVYFCWHSVNALAAFGGGSTLELGTICVQWVATPVGVGVVTAMCYKRVVQLRAPSQRHYVVPARERPEALKYRPRRPTMESIDTADQTPPICLEVVVNTVENVTYRNKKRGKPTETIVPSASEDAKPEEIGTEDVTQLYE